MQAFIRTVIQKPTYFKDTIATFLDKIKILIWVLFILIYNYLNHNETSQTVLLLTYMQFFLY